MGELVIAGYCFVAALGKMVAFVAPNQTVWTGSANV
jgi:hypothetical protein